MRKALVIACLVLSLRAYAQDDTNYKFYGFSDDLKYAAFEISWVVTAEDVYVSKIYFVDVDRNDYTMKPLVHSASAGDGNGSAISATNEKKAAPYMRQYGISGKKLGTSQPLKIDEEDMYKTALSSQTIKVSNKTCQIDLQEFGTGKTYEGWGGNAIEE